VDECAVLDGLVADIRRGEGRSLVVGGEAGIGKTALLEYLVASVSDLTVVRAVGVESEMELAFASLHQVCAPLLDRLEGLPIPQGQALEIVFGLSAGAAPDRFLVALGVLSLFSEVAEERPLLCVVDDAQWLDRASALALAFVARRLVAEPVGIVFAARVPSGALVNIPELEVRGVSNGDARTLLDSALGFKLDERVRDRIVAEMRGNPLALLELPRGLTATQLAGGFGLTEAQALSGPIEESFVQRLRTLSDEAQRLLLVAAAEPVGDPFLLRRAAERLGLDPAAARAAEAEGLLAIAERVTFRHPLVRSAAYRSGAVQDRRSVHLALAEVTDREADPDRRAWHLAAAAAGPDERVASELELSAGRAQARGGLAAAAAFLQRAVALTEEPGRGAERALAAAEASFQAGAMDEAVRLLTAAEGYRLDGFQSARADLLRGHIAMVSRYGNEAAPLLLQAARRLEPFDLSLARRAYMTAWSAAVTAHHLGGADALREICRAVRALPPLPPDPHPLDLVLEGFAVLITDGHAVATPVLQRAAKEALQLPVEDVVRWGFQVPGASSATWDDNAIVVYERQAQLVRDAGALAELPIHLQSLALERAWLGDLSGAGRLMAESESISTSTGIQVPPFALLRILGLQGREAEASALIEAVIQQGTAQGQGIGVMVAYWAAAVLYNGLGRYEEAASAAGEVVTNGILPWLSMWALFELVEAAARVGDTDLGRDALDRLAATTQPAGTSFALGIEARSRALLADGDDAEESYRDAIKQFSRTRLRPELARTHLLYGEWLRREGRRVEARERLRTAHEMFVAIGMEAFAERTRRELLAAGATVRRRSPETRDELTPQEEQIARLARDGLSNPEIGAKLFLSRRTVEWHLGKVFAKLGVASRADLRDSLPSAELETAPG
jgi:DNA-binding CsgD family transcriptional regulator/tetratricopeptide (TPR) repeat protein